MPTPPPTTQELIALVRAFLEANGYRPPEFVPVSLTITFANHKRAMRLPIPQKPEPPPTAKRWRELLSLGVAEPK